MSKLLMEHCHIKDGEFCAAYCMNFVKLLREIEVGDSDRQQARPVDLVVQRQRNRCSPSTACCLPWVGGWLWPQHLERMIEKESGLAGDRAFYMHVCGSRDSYGWPRAPVSE